MFQHTAARRRLDFKKMIPSAIDMFQHTAARRRLVTKPIRQHAPMRFNTQPPEGGW